MTINAELGGLWNNQIAVLSVIFDGLKIVFNVSQTKKHSLKHWNIVENIKECWHQYIPKHQVLSKVSHLFMNRMK